MSNLSTLNRRKLLLLPFDQILEEFSQYKDLLWFYEGGIKGLLLNLIANLSDLEETPIKDIDEEEHFRNLYGMGFEEHVIDEYDRAIEQLDRCNTAPTIGEAEREIILLLCLDVIRKTMELLELILKDKPIWVPDGLEPRWSGNRLVVPFIDK